MKILILHRELPFPADNGGKLRAAYLLQYLARHHEVALACFAHGRPRDVPASLPLSEFRQLVHPLRSGWTRRFSSLPSEVVELRSAAMSRYVDELIARWSPDVLLTSDPALSPYLEGHPARLRVLDYLMVLTLTARREQHLCRGPRRLLWDLRWRKLAAYHRRIAPLYDLCLVNSREDQEDLEHSGADWKQVEFLPNGLALAEYPRELSPVAPHTLIYPGSVTYGPNRDAVQYFVDRILPQVRREIPDVQLLITGAVPANGAAPQAPGVVYTGYVPDVRRVIAGAWACVVPLRSGAGGARFKVLEALALGTPIISTRIGAEGLEYTPGRDILLADDPDAFAAATIQLLRSPSLREALSRAGRELMERKYDWDCLGARVTGLLEQRLASRSGRPCPS